MQLLGGSWVRSSSGYERDLCEQLQMQQALCRYWDAQWDDLFLEFKKGKSIWLDLVRFSEILTAQSAQAMTQTYCLFFIPNSQRTAIEEIICAATKDVIHSIGLTPLHADSLLQIANSVRRSLNAQARLTVNDVRRIQLFNLRRVPGQS
jgi:hypothetical protein